MAAVSNGGINAPAPIPSASAEMLHVVEGVQVDVLTWLTGVPVNVALADRTADERADLFREIGRQMAHLHDVIDAWTPPVGFERCAWDRTGLLGEAPLWGRFWDNPQLTSEDRQLLLDLREAANAELTQLEDHLDYGLIHADLVSENIMVDVDRIQMIDFDDGGFGFRLFEIVTALVKYRGRPDYPALKDALIGGYLTVRQINLAPFNLFMAVRAATYVGWNIERITENGAKARNARLIADARDLARIYLAH